MSRIKKKNKKKIKVTDESYAAHKSYGTWWWPEITDDLGDTAKVEIKSSEAPTKQALRFDDDKLRFDLIPTEVIIELARAYSMGAIKYGDNNYRKGMTWSRCVRSGFSHFYKWLSGKTVDEETGCHHLALGAWNLLTLLYYEISKVGVDNRQKFNIDDNFDWPDNHLGLGLNKEKLAALKETYKHRRDPTGDN